MSRKDFPSEEQIRKNFNWALKAAVDQGIGAPSDNGFDLPVLRALRAVAQYFPNASDQLIQDARDAMDKQIIDLKARLLKQQELKQHPA